MKKPEQSSTVVNHHFYDYLRWNLISVVCLLSKTKLDLGKKACEFALQSKHKHEDDIRNYAIYKSLSI